MSWLSKALKKAYRWKEKHLKPKELRKIEPAIPAIIGAFNPIAGVIAQGLHTARMKIAEDWDREDAEREARRLAAEEAALQDAALQEEQVIQDLPNMTEGSQYSGGLGSGAVGGGIPVSMWPQLGSGIAQQTAAVRAALAKASGRRGGLSSSRRRKRKASKKRAKSRKTKTRGARLKKGSAAAKAWGKKMRALRQRRK